MTEEERRDKYDRAKKRVAELKKFYTELISYVAFITMLAGLNYYLDRWDYMWFLWPAFGWGIGLVFRAYKIYVASSFFGKAWEERKIREYIDSDDKNE